MSFNIEPLNIKFLDETLLVVHTTIKKCYPEIYSPQVVQFFIDYHSKEALLRRANDGEVYSLFENKKLIGTGFLVEEEIGGLYILPEYQGRRYGSKTMQFLLDRARTLQLPKIWLDATPNSKAIYEQFGFDKIEYKVMYVDKEEKYPLPYYYMEKNLWVEN